ncbi:MAG: sigma-70 family RNA polymerase sigma factor [Fuerstiella sp.]
MPPDFQPFDPELVITAVLRGETDRFRLLVREYGLLVRAYLSARLYHLDDVDDLAQEVFLIAFAKLESFESGKSFRDWLIGIAKYQLNNYWRKNSRRANAMELFREEVAAAIEPELESVHTELKTSQIECLLDCIRQLHERARRIVRAGLDGLRAETLASELGMSPNALYQARFRAHEALRKCMEQTDPETTS